MIEDDKNDFLLIKNPNTIIINELPSDQDKYKAYVVEKD
jgi:hypothetical protein